VDAAGKPVTTNNAITVTLANGEVITIAAGSASGVSDPVAVNRDDVFLEADSISNHINPSAKPMPAPPVRWSIWNSMPRRCRPPSPTTPTR
jgi:hypothetical protein